MENNDKSSAALAGSRHSDSAQGSASAETQSVLTDLILRGEVITSLDLERALRDTENVDKVDEFGRTALMAACLLDRKTLVCSLLDQGADPNRKCKDGNTPLHYCCKWTVETYDKIELENILWCKEEELVKDIVNLLLSRGAVLVPNLDGVKPPWFAALHAMGDVVDFFIQTDLGEMSLSSEDKVSTLELLGWGCVANDVARKEPYDAYSEAMHLRIRSFLEKSKRNPALEACLGHQECQTLEELQRIEGNGHLLEYEGILVADRLLPEKLKTEYLWDAVLSLGHDSVVDNPNMGFSYCFYLLQLEFNGKYELGKVMTMLHERRAHERGPQSAASVACTWQLIKTFLDHCRRDTNQVSRGLLLDNIVPAVAYCLSHKPFYAIFYENDADCLAEMLDLAERIDRMTKSCWHNKPQSKDEYSLAGHFLSQVTDVARQEYRVAPDNYSAIPAAYFLQVVSRLLPLEEVSLRDGDGNTVLQVLMKLVGPKEHWSFVLPTTNWLLHHNCPVDGQSESRTIHRLVARSIGVYGRFDVEEDKEYEELMTLFTPGSAVLTLEEMSSRTILRYKIPYRNSLPSQLWEVVEGHF